MCAALCVAVLAPIAHAGGRAPEAGEPSPPPPEGTAHMVRLRLDAGTGNALGVGYMHGHQMFMGWWGYGADVAMVGAEFGGADGVVASATARASNMPAGVETSIGVGVGDGDTVGVVRVGGYLSLMYADLGYSYSFAVGGDSPDWLSSHQFSLRVHIPVGGWN